MYLEKLNGPADVKKMDIDSLNELASEMRDALLHRLSIHGGHFGPNFGMVEATIAMHYVFNSPIDQFVFDVSHQTYCHKMLTGRQNSYLYEENFDDISGYSNPKESDHDFFEIGHTSTSVSLACGLAKARDVKGKNYNVVAVIGDGSLSGGEALEGLDFASELESNIIIIVNDNDMSIAENHGGLYQNLKLLRETNGKAKCNLFKSMGLDYKFVADGNNIEEMISALKEVKDTTKPTVVHIVTKKGEGYALAEKNKEAWHWCMPFDPKTGKSTIDFGDAKDYGEITCEILLDKMKEDKTLVTITSATPAVMGFTKDKRDLAGKQFVDVGIAEEHAVALASGIATGGGNAVYGVYSTFVQRTYDQISQDVCINNSPVTFLVFCASIYGMNDVTHLGIYDIPMLSNIPNLVYLAPTTLEDYKAMVDYATTQNEHPVAIRVPYDVFEAGKPQTKDFSKLNKYEVVSEGNDVAIIALGSFFGIGERVKEMLADSNINATLINPYFITGTDDELLESLKDNHKLVITIEDGVLDGGFGEKISRFYGNTNVNTINYGYKKEFLDRYNPEDILRENRITPEQIVEDIKNSL